MLFYFSTLLIERFSFLRVFTYISFRMVGAAATALVLSFVLGPWIIEVLRGEKLHQVVREGTPDSHAGKGNTPTMGGLIILGSTLISLALWGKFSQSQPSKLSIP